MAPGVVNGDVADSHVLDVLNATNDGIATAADTKSHIKDLNENYSTWKHKNSTPYQSPRTALVDRFIDEPRQLRVAVIGGGLAGISAGIMLPAKVPGIKLTIYEKNKDFVSEVPNGDDTRCFA